MVRGFTGGPQGAELRLQPLDQFRQRPELLFLVQHGTRELLQRRFLVCVAHLDSFQPCVNVAVCHDLYLPLPAYAELINITAFPSTGTF